jgi:septal ring-binding cell division protein DamX
MLVLRYFMYVGGGLLALLLLCAAVLPKPPAEDNTVASASDVPAIRIHSQQKWPERVVLDTNAQMPAPPAKVAQSAPLAGSDAASAKARVRDAFAQLPAEQPKEQAVAEVKKPEPKPVAKRRVARVRAAPEYYPPRGYYGYQQGYYGYPQQRMQVAQQPRFGFLW